MATLVDTCTNQGAELNSKDFMASCYINDLDSSSLAQTTAGKAQVYRWDFNVFDFAQRANGRPLFTVTMALLEDQGLLDGWLLDRQTVENYLTEVEGLYKPNPYHNNTHAADVTQTACVIMTALDQHLRSGGSSGSSGSCCCSSSANNGAAVGSKLVNAFACCALPANKAAVAAAPVSSAAVHPQQQHGNNCSRGLSNIERFAIIIASAVHDLAHPGVNNAYLVRTRDPQALTYNDRSVNEMMHASLAFKLAAESPELNIFKNFNDAEYEQVRKLVLDMVLSTDMDVHFALLKRFEDALASNPDVCSWSTVEQRSLLFQMLVHLADLANPSRPWPLALKWAEWVVTEFLSQGKREAQSGIAVSDMCNIDKVCMPAAQLFFIDRFMQPTLEAFRAAAPGFHRLAMPWLADTKAKWTVFKEAGVKLPHKDYPVLQPAASAGQLCAVLEGHPGCCKGCGNVQQHQ